VVQVKKIKTWGIAIIAEEVITVVIVIAVDE
jgi:hypothetical protein